MATEREVKLSAWAGFAVPALAGVVDGLREEAVAPVQLTATYYDTADLRLTRAGFSLRHRTGGEESGWTVKLPDTGTGGAGARVREEISAPGGASAMPKQLVALVKARARSEPLKPVAKLVTRRTRRRLVDEAGATVIEIDDDEVSVLEGRRVAARFREIEVEQVGEEPEGALERVVEHLRARGAGDAESASKIVRALGARASEPADLQPVRLDRTSSVTELVRASIVDATLRLLRRDPALRAEEDSEDVHQARVATRRLRSDLRTYRRLLDPEWNEALRDELRWLAAELGAVRDADVLFERLSEQAAGLGTADAVGVAALLHRLGEQRAAARAELLRALSTPRYFALLDLLHEAAAEPKVLRDLAGIPACEAVPDLVRRPWKHLTSAVAALGDDPPHEALHEVRIRSKRVRYAVEAVTPVVRDRKVAKKWASAVAGVQGVLGDMQDAVVAEAWLRDAVAADADADAPPADLVAEALAAGQLIALQQRIADQRVAEWTGAWKRASSKKLRSFLS